MRRLCIYRLYALQLQTDSVTLPTLAQTDCTQLMWQMTLRSAPVGSEPHVESTPAMKVLSPCSMSQCSIESSPTSGDHGGDLSPSSAILHLSSCAATLGSQFSHSIHPSPSRSASSSLSFHLSHHHLSLHSTFSAHHMLKVGQSSFRDRDSRVHWGLIVLKPLILLLCCPGKAKGSSPTPKIKSINSFS